MRFVFFSFVFVLASCVSNKIAPPTPKLQEEPKVSYLSEKSERKRPEYNSSVIKRFNLSEADGYTLSESDLKNEREKLIKKYAKHFQKRDETPVEAEGKNRNIPEIAKKDRSVPEAEKKDQHLAEKLEYPVLPEKVVKAEKAKFEVLEITGDQKRTAGKKNRAALPATSGGFVISTSPSYIGVSLEEARQLLEQFGNVKAVKVGDNFSLKLEMPGGMQTEEEAKMVLKKLINASFYDAYIEKIE